MSRNKRPELPRQTIFAAALIVALGGLIYELILGTAASFLIGDSIVAFSLATGLTLFGMGIGSLLSTRIRHKDTAFAWNEVILALVGGFSVLALYASYSLTPYYWLVFVLFSLVIGVCIGLEIPLMMQLFRARSGKATINLLGKVLALDYFGALIASLLFPFLLLPYLGLMRTAFAVALLNVAVAFIIFLRLGVTIRTNIFIVGAIAVLTISFLFSTKFEQSIDAAVYRDPIVHAETSSYQRIVLTQFQDDTRLYLNNQLQFSSRDEARYHETLAHSVMSSVHDPKRVAILGGGDGLIAREILKYPSVASVDLIDLDQAVTDLGKDNRVLRKLNHDSLHDKRLSVINADAYTTLQHGSAQYDVIIADFVDPSSERTAKLYSKEFYRIIASRLNPQGAFITQSTSSYFTPNAFATIIATVQAAQPERTITPLSVNVPSFGEWSFVMSTPKTTKLFAENPLSSLEFTNSEQLAIAKATAPSIRTNQVSSLLHPLIYTTYNSDMSHWRF